MPDDDQSTETTAEDTETQTGAEQETKAEEVTEEKPAEEEEEKLSPAELRKLVTKANAEAAATRVKLRETEARLSTAKTPEEFEAAVNDLRKQNDELTKAKIAAEHALPPELAELLKGSTEEELIAHAKTLAQFAPKPATKTGPLKGGLNPNEEDPYAGKSPAELAAGRGRNGYLRFD